MSTNTSLFIGEHEQLPGRLRAIFQEDSASASDSMQQLGASKGDSIAEASDYDSVAQATYCFCHGPESGFMVGCEGGCDDWFHGSCIGIKKKQKDLLKTFICPTCTSNGNGATVWEDPAEEIPEPAEEEMPFCPRQPQPPPAALPAQPVPPVLAAPRIRRVRKQPRAMKNTKGKASLFPANVATVPPSPAPMTLADARRNRAIRQKLRHSQPGDWNTPPGSRGPLPPDGDHVLGGNGSNSNDGDDNDQDGNRCKRHIGTSLSDLVAAVVSQNKATVQLRTYVDVEEQPTFVDKLVKTSLEKTLFGQQSD